MNEPESRQPESTNFRWAGATLRGFAILHVLIAAGLLGWLGRDGDISTIPRGQLWLFPLAILDIVVSVQLIRSRVWAWQLFVLINGNCALALLVFCGWRISTEQFARADLLLVAGILTCGASTAIALLPPIRKTFLGAAGGS